MTEPGCTECARLTSEFAESLGKRLGEVEPVACEAHTEQAKQQALWEEYVGPWRSLVPALKDRSGYIDVEGFSNDEAWAEVIADVVAVLNEGEWRVIERHEGCCSVCGEPGAMCGECEYG